ncbi:alpha-amylase family glycosyl hydrolase [Blastococcus goldschmidtiae]|uniref:Alpha-amylase family glycosyl hydrolase n=1 Tax=Blastococcus goldschmidtiae TaxID=3075546 RepID=A0ABU2K5H9_9ACTN|nr:alpha-amylase family glycosyl hydrolase [Blastococcus sp. DSM 46792]MDT0275452.1 alpha-amylase family glycosyl hydrolase [Blastococcus sp. DSM 46792]
MTAAEWSDTVIWWHVYPLGFAGAPVRPASGGEGTAHRLDRVAAWLDHVVELGLNGLALGPVFASQTHGYDTVDHFRVDPRLGDADDLDRLIAACHERGIRVCLDGVFNHVGRAHPAFAAVEAEGPAAPTAGLFRIDWSGWQPGDPVRADVFEGHDQLVALDHSAPEVADLVVRAMRYWLDRGVDGWRLDAAYAVPPEFWARVLPEVRRTHPGAWFTGEVIHGDAAAIVRASGMDSLTQYELWQAIWHGIAERNFFELAHALERHNGLLGTFLPSTFVGNHDVTRIASAVGAELVPHALAVLFTVAGVPSVYAGDEYGWTGVKEQRAGGDDAVRPEFPPRPPAPAELDATARGTLDAHRALVALRRRHPWLTRVHVDVVDLANEHVVLRSGTAGTAVVVALNLAPERVELPAADASTVECGNGRLAGGRVTLPARGWAVLTA